MILVVRTIMEIKPLYGLNGLLCVIVSTINEVGRRRKKLLQSRGILSKRVGKKTGKSESNED